MKYSLLLFSCLIGVAISCTNFIISPGATADNSSIITYNMDSHTLYGYMAHFPAGKHAPGTMRDIYDWETSVYLGQIPEAPITYSVVGNMNEFQVAIGETTFGGLGQLGSQPGAIIDYGSLIYIALQRSKTAREAISVMTSLVQTYGYASEGESFSIGDPNEVWVLEMIGKGSFEKGTVWVAQRVPNGYVCAHANQARIRQFSRNDPENVLFASDVVSFAKAHGFYSKSGSDEEFSFSDVYNPLSFEGARACEARVWSFFSKITTGMEVYLDYAQGYNLTNRMPLWVKPTRPLDVKTAIAIMRDHFEGTWFDFSLDVGAGAFQAPYRWRPLSWQVQGNKATYVNERAISTQQTGATFVAQMRSYLPNPVGGVSWFGVDDSALTVHVPVYCGITDIPNSLRYDLADIMTFSFDSAFWVFNLVSNFVYTRYDAMFPEVLKEINSREDKFRSQAAQVEANALDLIASGQTSDAIALLTAFSTKSFDDLVKDWMKYYIYLFVKYMDGNIKTPNPKNPKMPNVDQPGYGNAWYARIAKETGKHYEEPSTSEKSSQFWSSSKQRKI